MTPRPESAVIWRGHLASSLSTCPEAVRRTVGRGEQSSRPERGSTRNWDVAYAAMRSGTLSSNPIGGGVLGICSEMSCDVQLAIFKV